MAPEENCLCHAVQGFLATPITGDIVRVVHCAKHAAVDDILASLRTVLEHCIGNLEHNGFTRAEIEALDFVQEARRHLQ